MFVNTGGQRAYLNKTSWQILAPGVDVSHWGEGTFLRGSVHGVACKLHCGQGQTEGVNMVGQDWLSGAQLLVIADYHMDGCLLLLSDEATRSRFPILPVIGE